MHTRYRTSHHRTRHVWPGKPRPKPQRGRWSALLAAIAAASMAAVAPSGPVLGATVARVARADPALAGTAHRSAVKAGTLPPRAGQDLAVYGAGDLAGYHLYTASAWSGWRWRALATVAPGGGGDWRWIGQQCLTGDGRTVVVVIAPWSVNNSEQGMDSGALAYAVNVRSGAVRPIAGGVSLAYFDPGCGADGTVTLTSYLGPAQRPTRVSVFDAASGRLERTATVPAEVTSAVAAGGRVLAAEGPDLVDITGSSLAVVHRFGGQLADLHPSADGGLDLTARGTGGSVQVWHYSQASGARLLGSGNQAALRLLGGAHGHNILANPAHLVPASGLVAVRLPGAAAPEGASSRGGLVQVTDTGAPLSATHSSDGDVAVWQRGSAGVARVHLPLAAARTAQSLPTLSNTNPGLAGPGRHTSAVRPRGAAVPDTQPPDTT
ncbi:MAG TPA: hypothetical protein VGS19_08510, partial [Streptosporangiaceae bacterium]|nr:hypothetical protein [Streptosporangiaceae bacterium]